MKISIYVYEGYDGSRKVYTEDNIFDVLKYTDEEETYEKYLIDNEEEKSIKTLMEFINYGDDYINEFKVDFSNYLNYIENEITEKRGWNITKDKNLVNSPMVQLRAVVDNPNIIRDIDKPSPIVLKYINSNDKVINDIMSWGSNIQFVEDQKEEYQMKALEDSISNFKYIKEPTETVKKYAEKIKSFGEMFYRDYDAMLREVKEDGMSLRYFFEYGEYWDEVDDNLIIEAIKQNPNAMEYFYNIWDFEEARNFIIQDEELTKKRLKDLPYLLSFIEDPTKEMFQVIVDQGTDSYAFGCLYEIYDEDKVNEIYEMCKSKYDDEDGI